MAALVPEQDWMSPEEFNQWFRRLGLSQSELGRRLDVKQATISRWLAGDRKIEHGAMLRHALERLEQILAEERRPKRGRRGVRSDQSREGTDAG